MGKNSSSQSQKMGDYLEDMHRWDIILKCAVKKHNGKEWSGLIWDGTEISGTVMRPQFSQNQWNVSTS